MTGRSSVIALPTAAAPRLLLERSRRSAAAAALRSFGAHMGVGRGVALRGGAVALHLGGGALLPSATALWTERFRYLESRIHQALDRDDVAIAIRLSPDRPNAKPVAQVMTVDGHTIAYGKVGWDPQGRRLVDHEAGVLRELARRGPFSAMRVPEVLDLTDRDDTTLLLLSDIRGTPRAHDGARLVPVLHEIAATEPGPRTLLGDTPAWKDLMVRLDQTTEVDDSPIVEGLVNAAGSLQVRHGHREVDTGRMHGDFVPANVGVSRNLVSVWDWERSRTGAPVGVDALHRAFATTTAASPAGRVAATLDQVRPFQQSAGLDDETMRGVLMLDLLDRSLRFREGRVGGTTAVDTVNWRTLRWMHEEATT